MWLLLFLRKHNCLVDWLFQIAAAGAFNTVTLEVKVMKIYINVTLSNAHLIPTSNPNTISNFDNFLITEFQQKYGMVDWPKHPTLHEQKATVSPRGSNEYTAAVKNIRK